MSTETITKLMALVREGRDLIEEAMTTHIYDEDNGEEPDEDCGYAKHIKEVDDLLADLWDGKTDSDGEPCLYRNHYHCEECDTEWEDEWSCACNDRCPSCGTETEPHESDEWDFDLGEFNSR